MALQSHPSRVRVPHGSHYVTVPMNFAGAQDGEGPAAYVQSAPDNFRPRIRNARSIARGKETGMKKFLLAVAAVVLGSASVQAADLAAHYTKAPMMATAYNWTGF